MNPIDEQSRPNLSNPVQITFKLASSEKENLVAEAKELGINISEYCRIKCLSVESDVIALRNSTARLEKEVKVLNAKLQFYKGTVRDDNSITLQLTEEQNRVLRILALAFSEKELSPGEQVIEALVHLCTFQDIWRNFPEWRDLDRIKVKKLFNPDAEY